jgi:predicted kinase
MNKNIINAILEVKKKNKKAVFIMRGLPGSGKSTIVDSVSGAFDYVASADRFFLQAGKYNFEPSLIGSAHKWCLRKFVDAIIAYLGDVFVDNTNTSISEFDHYVKLAKTYGYRPVIVCLYVTPEISAARNLHGVPKKTIYDMVARMEATDPKLENYAKKNRVTLLC